MNTTEKITWHPASEPPDNDRTVLVKTSLGSPAWPGAYALGVWTVLCVARLPDYGVECWAEMPRGPQA